MISRIRAGNCDADSGLKGVWFKRTECEGSLAVVVMAVVAQPDLVRAQVHLGGPSCGSRRSHNTNEAMTTSAG
jgi:hypothetical protein